jgi:hypothetical protein
VFAVAGVAVLALSSCFALTGFILQDSSLAPGESTKARFTVRPYVPDGTPFIQFFLVGYSSTEDISLGKGTWGTNGNFGGPTPLDIDGDLAQALNDSDDCNGGGLDFQDVFGTLAWKGYTTQSEVGGGNVNKVATVDVNLKAKGTSAGSTSVNVMGITGAWDDDGDGDPEATDTFYCTGNATVNVWVKAA